MFYPLWKEKFIWKKMLMFFKGTNKFNLNRNDGLNEFRLMYMLQILAIYFRSQAKKNMHDVRELESRTSVAFAPIDRRCVCLIENMYKFICTINIWSLYDYVIGQVFCTLVDLRYFLKTQPSYCIYILPITFIVWLDCFICLMETFG